MTSTSARSSTVWERVARGALGGLAAGLAMNLFVRTLEAAYEGGGADPLSVGAGPAGRGAQPLQAAGRPDDDAATRTGAAVYRTVTGAEPTRERRLWLGSAAHYAFAVGAGEHAAAFMAHLVYGRALETAYRAGSSR